MHAPLLCIPVTDPTSLQITAMGFLFFLHDFINKRRHIITLRAIGCIQQKLQDAKLI